MASDLLFFNGVNATRGEYAREPTSAEALADKIAGASPDPARLDPDKEAREDLRRRAALLKAGAFEVKEGVNKGDLAEAGWGLVVPAAADYRPVLEALGELRSWRQRRAGARYRELAYQPGETKAAFLRRNGAATSGPVDPDRLPYYLLIVGSPEEIPFRFQYQLDVQYAVGRLHFDTLEEYASYGRSVVAAERGEARLPRRAVFFGVQNPDDVATNRAAADLVAPLAAAVGADERAGEGGWQVEMVGGPAASKERLAALLGGADTPALLFTASHGVEFDQIDPRQRPHQGGILCSDWPGPRAWSGRALPPKFYLSGDDIGADARLLGTVAFHFACFGAGTPRLDDFPHERGAQAAIAPHAFVAGLPRRLLGHPKGGALAVIGHVERAWTYSFSDVHGGRQIETFRSALGGLVYAGVPVGAALEYFNNRYAELATVLTGDLEEMKWGARPDPYELTAKWTEHNDARSYVVLGDPAARLAVAPAGEPTAEARPAIPEVGRPAAPSMPSASSAPQDTPMTDQPAAGTPAPATGTPAPTAGTPAPGSPAYGAPPAPAYGQPLPPPAGYPPPIVIYYGAPPPAGQPGAAYPPGSPPQPPAGAGSSFGIGDWLRGGENAEQGGGMGDFAQNLTNTLKEFSERLGDTMKQVLEDAAYLEVETYVADDLADVDYKSGDFAKASLRAVTRMKLDGDTKVLVPLRAGELDEQLWDVHTAMVAQAQANRAEMVRAIASAAAGLLGALRGK